MSWKSRAALLAALAMSVIALVAPVNASAFGPISGFGSVGSGAGQLVGPGGIAVAPDGSLYVADFTDRRIDVFSATGEFKFAFGKGVNAGNGAGEDPDLCTEASGCKVGGITVAGAMSGPEGLAISGGDVYVGDIGENRIDVFTLAGKFLFSFGKGVNAEANAANPNVCTAASGCKFGEGGDSAGTFERPEDVGVGPGGDLYVADVHNNRIQVFTATGEFKFAFGKGVNAGNGAGENRDLCTRATGCKKGAEGVAAGEMRIPFDVKPISAGLMAVSDRGNRRIDVYSTDGAFKYAFAKGVNPGDASGVCSLVCKKGDEAGATGTMFSSAIQVDGAGNVYIADDINNRVSQFTVSGQFQRSFGEGVLDGTAAFQICLPTTACQPGLAGTIPGAIPETLGLAVAPDCSIYTTESLPGTFVRVQKFGDVPGTPAACPPVSFPAPSGGTPEGTPAGPPPPHGVVPPSNEFRFGKLTLNKKGTATLAVTVPGPGSLVLKGKGLHTATATATGAGSVQLGIKLTGKAKSRLARTGTAKVKAQTTFTPTGGSPLTQTKTLTLKKILR